MVLTCSRECRKRAGMKERKYYPRPQGLEELCE